MVVIVYPARFASLVVAFSLFRSLRSPCLPFRLRKQCTSHGRILEKKTPFQCLSVTIGLSSSRSAGRLFSVSYRRALLATAIAAAVSRAPWGVRSSSAMLLGRRVPPRSEDKAPIHFLPHGLQPERTQDANLCYRLPYFVLFPTLMVPIFTQPSPATAFHAASSI